MFKINSYTDLKVAYEILEIAYESGRSQKAVDLKREMRAFFHRPVSERRIVQDDGIGRQLLRGLRIPALLPVRL